MEIKIKRWDNNKIIICGEYENIRMCLERNRDKSFYRADLRGTNLFGADLRGANLFGANLFGTDLRGTNLSGANLFGTDLRGTDLRGADLSGANLFGTDLRGTNLFGANLSGADLRGADLRGTDLRRTDLRGANLSGADLRGADLRGADLKKIPQLNNPTINEYIKQNKIQKDGTKIIVFKGVTKDLQSPQQGTNKITYEIGEIIKVKHADCNVWTDCSYGINLSPTIESAKKWGQTIIKCEVDIGDIVCIPINNHDQKFRVKKCKVLGVV